MRQCPFGYSGVILVRGYFIYQQVFESGAGTLTYEEEDRYVKLHSVKCRAPLLDLRLPQSERMWAGETKVVLRRSMKGMLPEIVRTRTDGGHFTGLMDRELQIRQREKIEALLRHSVLVSAGIFDRRELQHLWQQYIEAEDLEQAAGRW